jgi:dihydroflavonol-4-reductase
MRAFVTGGAGFIGRALVRRLRSRGDDVVAAVRDPSRAGALLEAGCSVVRSDLSEVEPLAAQMRGADIVFHLAGMYRLGILPAERAAMHGANVRATQVMLDAAVAAGVGRILYVSTINAFGNTRGRVVDESYLRREPFAYVSYYDETKHLGHLAAERRMAAGAPITIVQPGGVYGPDDPSQIGGALRQAAAGKLRGVVFPDLGMNMVHVDDLADGIVRAAERGRAGETYVLGGELTRMRDLVAMAADAGGHRPPQLTVPDRLLRAVAAISRPFTRLIGQDLGELVSASAGVTYWASDAKARRELGYAPRELRDGLRATFAR